jgi:hypothetical protein
MSQTIKLKNSTNTSAPSSLQDGELALGTTTGAEKLYMKNSSGSIVTLNDWSKLLNKPTTLSGYGITDAASSSHTHNYAGSNSAGGSANSVANTLTFSGYSTNTFNGSSAVTVPIPFKVSQLTNDSAFLTAITKSQVEGVLTGVITSHTHNYLTGNQTITLSGDVTGSGTTGIVTSLKNVGTAGTYRSVTTDAQGRVTAGTNPTTLSGYGITDAVTLSSYNTHVSSSLHLTTNQLNVLNRLSIVDDKIQISGSTYATGEMSAYGSGTGSGGGSGLISTVYGTSGFGGVYSNADFTNTFNAYAINSLYNSTQSNTNSISTLNSSVSSLSSTVSTLNSNVSSLSSTVASLSGGTTSFSSTYYNSSSGKYVYYGGYTKLPSGLILEWGYLQGDDGVYSFPYTFPTKCLSIVLSTNRTTSGSNGTNHAGNVTNSTFQAVLDGTNGWFFAVGY